MRPAKKQRPAEGGQLGRALAWLNSYSRCSRWMERYDIDALLEEGGGICKISGFLPDFVAEGALQILESLPPARWNDTAAEVCPAVVNVAAVKAGAKLSPAWTPAPVQRRQLHPPVLLPGTKSPLPIHPPLRRITPTITSPTASGA